MKQQREIEHRGLCRSFFMPKTWGIRLPVVSMTRPRNDLDGAQRMTQGVGNRLGIPLKETIVDGL